MGKEKNRGKKTTTLSPHPQAWHWPLFFSFFFLSVWQIQALAALLCPPPYLLSQQCITCHFRIMSPHVHNDIAFVLQITSGLYSNAPTPATPSHAEAGRKSQIKLKMWPWSTAEAQMNWALSLTSTISKSATGGMKSNIAAKQGKENNQHTK